MVKRSMLALLLVVALAFPALADAPAPKDERKQTSLGKYVTSLQAYEMWKADPAKVKVLDVRTPEEYVFVGHASMAHNVPSQLWAGKYNAEKKDFPLVDNPDFEAQLKKKFSEQDLILVMCRSGQRSAAAINRMAKAGFVNAYNVVDGFEGDKVADDESTYKGKRIFNGWKNTPVPWTYDLDPALIFVAPEK